MSTAPNAPRWLDDPSAPATPPAATTEGYDYKLTWAVKYRDGVTFAQRTSELDNSSELIDHKRLWILQLRDKSGKVVIAQEYRKGQMPFYRRRTALRIGENIIEVIHIFGWRSLSGDTHVVFVYESDLRIEMGDFRKEGEVTTRNEEWQYPINFRDIDGVIVE